MKHCCNICNYMATRKYVITNRFTDEIENVEYLCSSCARELQMKYLLELL